MTTAETAAEPRTDELVSRGENGVIGMLSDLSLCAARPSDHLPSLTAVRLHTDSNGLHGWSTNRFVAAHAYCRNVASTIGTLDGPFTIGVSDVKHVVDMFKKSPYDIQVTVDRVAGCAQFTDGVASMWVEQAREDLPHRLPRVVDRERPPDASLTSTFDPKWLNVFTQIARRRGQNVQLHPSGRTLPAHVQVGPYFRGWLMPMRTEYDWLPESW